MLDAGSDQARGESHTFTWCPRRIASANAAQSRERIQTSALTSVANDPNVPSFEGQTLDVVAHPWTPADISQHHDGGTTLERGASRRAA